jgi:hypothetical protein
MTLRDLVQQGLRESGIIPVGSQPDSDIFEETLGKLKSIISRIFGEELGEFLSDVDVDECVKREGIRGNSRVLFLAPEALTLTLPKAPQDGSRFSVVDVSSGFSSYPLTLQGNGRKIGESAQLILNTNDTNKEYFYRADLAQWREVTSLTADDESPFPAMYDDLLTIMLAMRINYRYGMQTDLSSFQKLQRRFKSQYKQAQEVGVESSLLRLTSNINFISDFNTGRI